MNPPDSYHAETVSRLARIWLRDADLGDAVARLPWLEGRVDSVEASVIRDMARLARADIDIARKTTSLAWVANQPTVLGGEAIQSLTSLVSADPQLAKLIVDLPWFSDDIRYTELDAIDDLTRISSTDFELAKRILSSPKFADDINKIEADALSTLRNLALRDAVLLSLWGEYAISESGDVTGLVLDGINHILRAMNQRDNWIHNSGYDNEYDLDLEDHWWSQLLLQPWFVDGLDKEELALVGVLGYLSRIWGEEAMSAALRELYLLFGETGDAKAVTEEEIYQAVLRNTPPGLQEEFLALYRQSRTPDSVAEES